MHHLLRDAGFGPAAVAWLLAAVTGVIGTAAALAVKAHVPAPLLLAVFGLLVIGHFLATLDRDAAVRRLSRLPEALKGRGRTQSARPTAVASEHA
jgi:UDP-GlcNAc:undecaprenyl-phosphate GlcNAc-1-phosphate transferase